MNFQRKLIKRICVAGMSGAIIVSMAAAGPAAAFSLDHVLAAECEEEKLWEDMTEEERMALPEEERERLKAEAEVRAEEVRRWESMTEEERMALPEEERERLRELAEKAKKREEAAEAEKPDSEGGIDTPVVPENPDTGNEADTPEKPETPSEGDTAEKPETPGEGDAAGKPESPGEDDTAGKPETPGEGDVTEKPEDSKKPDDEDENEKPDGESGSGNSANSKDPDKNDINKVPADSKKPNRDEGNGDSAIKPVKENGLGNIFGSVNLKGGNGTSILEKTEISSGLTEPDAGDSSVDHTDNAAEELIPGKISNEELIADQQIVKLPEVVENSHFWTVARKYSFAKESIMIREKPYEEGIDEDAVRNIGKIKRNGLLYILEEGNGWYYVESGRVRGFVRDKEVITGDKAGKLLKRYQKKAKKQAKEKKIKYKGIEGVAPMAKELVHYQENEAFTYLRATVNQTVAEKNYALASEGEVEVKEDKSADSRTVGKIPSGGLCYILEDKDQDWIYIESGDVRGFVEGQDVSSGEETAKAVEKKGEEKYSLAEKTIETEENTAYYYTLTSTKPGLPSGEIRKSMIEYASQFIGNPYVWGGTSLTKGADCSGFVQSIYKQYGYTLPRVACDQAQYGVKIPVEDALPGDLIFYAKDGYIHHVVMYAGDGKTIEAMSSKAGIVQANLRKGEAVWATRILDDNDYSAGNIGEVNATEDMYGLNLGKFKLTYYCSCEICCDVETGITATGVPVVEGRTIAVDPSVIPYGTQVIIGGHVFTAEDCGGAIKGNRIDIYVNDHQKALGLGVDYANVYLKK